MDKWVLIGIDECGDEYYITEVDMPTAEDVPEEELNAFFTENGLGEGAAFENGEYNEDLKSSYSFHTGRSAYEARQAQSGQAETE